MIPWEFVTLYTFLVFIFGLHLFFWVVSQVWDHRELHSHRVQYLPDTFAAGALLHLWREFPCSQVEYSGLEVFFFQYFAYIMLLLVACRVPPENSVHSFMEVPLYEHHLFFSYRF